MARSTERTKEQRRPRRGVMPIIGACVAPASAVGLAMGLAMGLAVGLAPTASAVLPMDQGLSGQQILALVDDPSLIPPGLGLVDHYAQQAPPQGLDILLCYDKAFKPVMLPKAPGAWQLMQGTAGVGYGIYVFQYPNARAAKAAGKVLLAAKCPAKADDPALLLQQSQRRLPAKAGAPGWAVSTTYRDDGELETTERALRQVGLAVLEASAVYQGGPDSPVAPKVRAALAKSLDAITAKYVKATK